MGRWHSSRTDVTAKPFADYFEAHGATVLHLGRPMDWLVIYQGQMRLVDPKGSAKTPVTPTQQKLLREFPDLAFLVFDEADCAAVLETMR